MDFDLSKIEAEFVSERSGNKVKITIDDVIPLYADTNIDQSDVIGVRRLFDRVVKICKSERVGTLSFCVEAKDELVVLKEKIVDTVKEIRHSKVNRRFMRGARERNKIIELLETSLDEINDEIEKRGFREGRY